MHMKGISTYTTQNWSAILGNNCSFFFLWTSRYPENWNGFYATLYSLCYSSQREIEGENSCPSTQRRTCSSLQLITGVFTDAFRFMPFCVGVAIHVLSFRGQRLGLEEATILPLQVPALSLCLCTWVHRGQFSSSSYLCLYITFV